MEFAIAKGQKVNSHTLCAPGISKEEHGQISAPNYNQLIFDTSKRRDFAEHCPWFIGSNFLCFINPDKCKHLNSEIKN